MYKLLYVFVMGDAINDSITLAFKEFIVQQRSLSSCFIKEENIKNQMNDGNLTTGKKRKLTFSYSEQSKIPKEGIVGQALISRVNSY